MSQANEAAESRGIAAIVARNLFSVFNLIILGITGFVLGFYLAYGDPRLLLDAVGMVAVALLNTAVAVVQEIRAKIALDKVNMLLRRDVAVIRGGLEQRVPVEEVRAGDLLVLRRGDQAVADGRLEISEKLEMDESLLTGESKPVRKGEGDEVLSGSFAVAGTALLRAERVGDECYAAGVTKLAKKRKFVLTPLQRRIDAIIKILFACALVLAMAQGASELLRPSGASPSDFARRIASILISLVPQGLVLSTSVTFALGVFRISRIGAIVQKLNAIESFANVKVICMDKTGTLTENRLALRALVPLDPGMDEAEARALLGGFASLSVEKNATARALEPLEPLQGMRKLDELPFSSATKMSAVLAESERGCELLVLGAFDLLSERLHDEARERAEAALAEAGLRGERNLLFARASLDGGGLEAYRDLADAAASAPLEPICAVSISDSPRPDAAAAIERFRADGIGLKVLSGDAPDAVAAVLKRLGWELGPDDLVTGADLDAMDDSMIRAACMARSVFARLRPEHKLRLLEAYKALGVYAAMIGDGVNDLPAIKDANMGIAMEEGSSITKEVADIVLLGNKFSLLPAIFDEGNKIVNTVKAVAKLFLAKNALVIILSLATLLFGAEFPLTPRRVSLLNIFGIGLPAVIIAFRNRNTARPGAFMPEVLGHSVAAALAMLAAMLGLGAALGPEFIGPARDAALMWLLVFLFVLNFVLVSREAEGRLKPSLAFGLVFMGLMALLSTIDSDFGPYAFVKGFYEVETLPAPLWPPLLSACAGGGVLTLVLHAIRKVAARRFVAWRETSL